jgi:uncharacterized membrane protein
MNHEDDIRELQRQAQNLASEMEANLRKLRQIQDRLAQLTGTELAPEVPAAPVAPAPAATPREESGSWSVENFIGLRIIHLVGIVVLVIGLSIGVKYAIDRNLISEALRILLAYSAGLLLCFLSVRLREKYSGFSAILFSGGMASLYFTTYAAYVYYGMFSSGLAFALMVLMTLIVTGRALQYNRQEIALLGLVGAYAIPFLVSRNAERADLFFVYILVINCGILYLSYKRDWRPVGRLAQAITWVFFLGWTVSRFTEDQTLTGMLFMTLFFLLFMATVFSGKIFRKQPLTRNDVNQVWLNNVSVYLGSILMFAPVFETDILATVTGLFSVFTGIQTAVYFSLKREEKYLRLVHLVFSLFLAVIYVLFEWDGVTVTLLWLLMAVLFFACGVWVKSVALRISGMGLIGLTLLKLLIFDTNSFSPVQKIIAYITLGVLLLVLSFFYQKFKEKIFGSE